MAKGRLGFVEIVIIILSIAFLAGYIYESSISGFDVKVETKTIVDNVNIEIDESGNYSLKPQTDFGTIKSIRITGNITGDGEAQVYVEHNNTTYLLYDSNFSEFEGSLITAFVVLNESEPEINETINQSNETEKQIFINLDYKIIDSNFDTDNDGVEEIDGVVDLTVFNSNFNWDVNERKLCTKWEINNNEGLITTICNGNDECCALIELAPTDDLWNAAYYAYIGKDNVSQNNTITAQIIYLDQGIDEEVYFEAVYSEPESKQAIFVPPSVRTFNNSCVETCLFGGFTEDEYKLIVNITNATLFIESIIFDIETLDYIPPEQRERTVYIRETVDSSIEESIQWLLETNYIDIGSLYALHEANKILDDQRLTTLTAEQLDRTSDFYLPYKRLILEEPFSLSELDENFFDYRYNSNLIPILRCQQQPISAKFLDKLVDIRGDDEQFGAYDDLHVLLALTWIKERDCWDTEFISTLIEKRIALVEKRPLENVSVDVFAERLAFIQYAGYSISSEQVVLLTENQNPDGGFGLEFGDESHSHSTAQALWAMAEWSNG